MAELKYLVDLNLLNNQLKFPRIHNLGSAPTNPSPVAGQIYFSTASGDNALQVYDGSNWVRLAGQVAAQAVDTIASGDKIAFSDESQGLDVNNALTVDNLFITAPKLVSTAAIANGDFMLFLDGGATGDMKKEAVADIATLFAGAGMTAGSSVINVIGGDGITANADNVAITAAQTTVTTVTNAALKLARDTHNFIDFGTDDQIKFTVATNQAITFKASGEIEATKFDGALEGNADTATLADEATILADSRNIAATGDIAWNVDFNGSADVTAAATIQATSVEGSMLNNNIVSGLTDIGAAIVKTDELIISDAGTIKRTDVSRLGTFFGGDGLAVSNGVLAVGVDDSSIEINSDAIRVKAGGIATAMLANDAVDVDKLAANSVVNASVTANAAIVQTKINTNVDLGGDIMFGNQTNDTVEFTGHVSGSATSTGSFGVLNTPHGVNFTIDNHSDQGAKIFYTNASSQDNIIIQAGTRNMIEMHNPYNNNSEGEVVVNEDSLLIDFRAESGEEAYMLYVEADTDRVGIATSSPSQVLDVNGNAKADSFIAGSTVLEPNAFQMIPSQNDTFTIASSANGATSITTVDAGAAAAHLSVVVDGNFSVASTGIDIAANGTITNAVWNGTKIADAYLSDNTVHLDTAQTISAVKTIGTNVKLQFRDSNSYIHSNAANDLAIIATDVEIAATNIILDAGTAIALEGNTTVTGNLSITGTLNIDGDTTIIDSTTVAIADGMMKLAKDQANNADAIDFGFYGQYGVGGTHTFAGIYRDLSVSGDPFVFFDSLTTEPTTTVAQNAGFDLADIMAGTITAGDGFTGDLTGTSSLVVVTNSNAGTAFPIVFHDESSALLDDTGTFEYTPESGVFDVPIVRVHTSLVPNADDGATIGSANLNFSDLFLADGAVLNFGDDQEVKLTHVADTGLLLNSTMKIQFNDASQFIHGSSNAQLQIGATDEIGLTATLVDMDANLDLDGTADISGLLTVQTGIVPNAQDGGYLGTTSLQWSDLFMADGAVIGFGDNNEVTLTHVHDTGLLLNGAMKIQFNDASQFIHASSNAQLQIGATDEIGLTATLVDMDANLDLDGTANISGLLTVQTGIVPNAQDGGYLGTTSLQWSDLFMADGAVIGFGDDNEVTLTHVADTGLLLNGAMKIQFNDASQFIHANSNAELTIAATDAINLTSTDVVISGTATTTGVHTFTEIPLFPNDTIETADIQDNAVSLAKMAHGTDGNIISFDANGAPVAIATGTDGQVLTSGGAGTAPAFADAVGVSHKATIGDGSATTFAVTHNMGSRDVMVQLYDISSNDTVYAQVIRTNTAKVDITFNAAPANNDIRVLISKL